jgi:hypothetical protein
MTSSYRISVASVKFLISQNPKIAHCLCPGNIGSKSPYFAIFLPIIEEPASPNPKANNIPILVMAFSIISTSFESF